MARYRKRNAAARRRAREFAEAGPILCPVERRETAAMLRELHALVRERLAAAFAVVDDPAAGEAAKREAYATIDASRY
jgi:hypothetical protein